MSLQLCEKEHMLSEVLVAPFALRVPFAWVAMVMSDDMTFGKCVRTRNVRIRVL